jgi:hypothetical protein
MAKLELLSPQSDYNITVIPATESPVATPASGDPVVCGQIPGVCQANADSVTGAVAVSRRGAFTLTVNAVNDSGNSAVNNGDTVYFTAAHAIKLSKEAVGSVRFGYAFDASVASGTQLIASGSSGAIPVLIGY